MSLGKFPAHFLGTKLKCDSSGDNLLRGSFHSVVVITCASHAQGRRFEPGWKHDILAPRVAYHENNKFIIRLINYQDLARWSRGMILA